MRWTDRLYAARDTLLTSPKFQSWAASFPLTRPIARRRASALFDLTAGFVYAQILSACIRLRLLEVLRDGPRTADDLAAGFALTSDATTRLLKAAAALGLVARRGTNEAGADRWGLGMDGAALLGNPGVAAMIAHHDMLYADLADPVALLRGERATALSRFWSYAGRPGADAAGDDVAPYSTLMSASQPLISTDILDAYDFAKHRHLLDAGGGEGAFLCAAAMRAPGLKLTLFDLPPVAVRAQARFAREGLARRADAIGGDLWRDPLPAGADVVSLVRVLHDHDDAAASDLLARIGLALPPGGTIVIAEPMVTGADDSRVGDAYFGFYLLAMGSGRARTPAEIFSMLRQAGFAAIRRAPTRRPLLCSLIVAEKPRNVSI